MNWRRDLRKEMPVLCERYPHVADKLDQLWGTGDCMDELCQLIEFEPTPERPYRSGFSWDAAMELQKLARLHMEDFPELQSEMSRRITDVWNNG